MGQYQIIVFLIMNLADAAVKALDYFLGNEILVLIIKAVGILYDIEIIIDDNDSP